VLKRLEAVIDSPRPFVRTRSYFGPDRRRKSSLDYDGPERRRTKLSKVSLSKQKIVKRRRWDPSGSTDGHADARRD